MFKAFNRIASLFLCFSLAFFDCTILHAENLEYGIKAEFLERFTRLIDWPDESSVSDKTTPFQMCVIGENPFGTYLNDLAEDATIHGKAVVLNHITGLDEIDQCNLLFISRSEEKRLSEILTRTETKPVLTVGDTSGFAQQGVLINLYDADGFIRFEINLHAVEKSTLRFRSGLLRLARLVN